MDGAKEEESSEDAKEADTKEGTEESQRRAKK